MDWDKAHELREVIDDYLKEIAKLGALPQDEEDQKQVKSAAIRQGKRRYFVDLRENTRGRFVKVYRIYMLSYMPTTCIQIWYDFLVCECISVSVT